MKRATLALSLLLVLFLSACSLGTSIGDLDGVASSLDSRAVEALGAQEEAALCVSGKGFGQFQKVIVSSEWLADVKNRDKLTIVDIRDPLEFAAGHIESSISIPCIIPFSAWTTMRGELLVEVPEVSELQGMLGSFGITKQSKIVIVTSIDAPYPYNLYQLSNATRVASTLIYAGVRNVAVLDGGYQSWTAAGNPVTTDVSVVSPVAFKGKVDSSVFVSMDYVSSRLGLAILVDARDANVYSGEVTEPWAAQPGHIPTAVSLPTPLMWNADGTYKTKAELAEIAGNVVGTDKNKEIIVYCGVGGYASSWYLILSDLLNYKNVKIFDGSAQEWSLYQEMVM